MGHIVDDEGFLVDEKDVRIKDEDGKETKLFFHKESVEDIVKSRLGREKKAHEAQIEKLILDKEAALKIAGTQETKDQLQEQIASLETQLTNRTNIEARRTQEKMEAKELELESVKKDSLQMKKNYQAQVLTAQLNSAAAKCRFRSPEDLMHCIIDKVEWEDVIGQNNQPTGKQTWSITLPVPIDDDSGKTEPRLFKGDEGQLGYRATEDIAKIIARQFPYYINGSGTGGTGFSLDSDRDTTIDLESKEYQKMSATQKMEAGYGAGTAKSKK